MSKISSKKYRLNKGSSIKKTKTASLYPKGGISVTSYKFTYDGTIFVAHAPYKLAGKADPTTYKSANKALSACNSNTKCAGITEKDGSFTLNTSAKKTKAAGYQAFVKGNLASVQHKYIWEVVPGKVLTKKYGTKSYSTFDSAATVCAATTECKGVSLVSEKYYPMGTETMKKKTNTASWIQRGATTAYSSYYWTKTTGYKGATYTTTTSYTSLNVAQTKCLADSKCGGVTKSGAKYYTNSGYKIASSSGTTVYVRGGAEASSDPVTVPKHGYTWTLTTSWRFIKLGTKYTARDDAFKKCAEADSCKGVTLHVSTMLLQITSYSYLSRPNSSLLSEEW